MSTAVVLDEDGSELGHSPEVLRVGLLGCGTVGSPVAKALLEEGSVLEQTVGARLELVKVAVRDPRKARPVRLAPEIVTTDALAIAIDPEIDIVIELMGGIDPAYACIRSALDDNKSVITANKELLAGVGANLLDDPDTALSFEASVCGAIPIVQTLKEYCCADRIDSFTGIFSGTCNFVLSQMTRSRCSFDQALAEAQQLGLAEADATADIEAFDAAAKVALLARVAFGIRVTIDDVSRKGISWIDRTRIGAAATEGYVYKLVGGARRAGTGVNAWVRPILVARDAPLAHIDGAENAIAIHTARAGRLRLQGQGAGGDASAAAILGDVVAAARRRVRSPKQIRCQETRELCAPPAFAGHQKPSPGRSREREFPPPPSSRLPSRVGSDGSGGDGLDPTAEEVANGLPALERAAAKRIAMRGAGSPLGPM